MNKYINPELLKADIRPFAEYDSNLSNKDWVRRFEIAIDAQPAADVRENVRGEWIRWYEEIKHDGYTEYIPHCKCPKCETEYDSHTAKFINFCPNCGAQIIMG